MNHATRTLSPDERAALRQRLVWARDLAGRLPAPLTAPALLWEHDGALRVHPLARATTLGRSPHAELHFDDPKLSTRHCRLVRIGLEVYLLDLDSRNGTWVNRQRIERKALVDGDVILVGLQTLCFREP